MLVRLQLSLPNFKENIMAGATSGPAQDALRKKIKINPKGAIRKTVTRADKQKAQIDAIFNQDHATKKQH
jgi:hypothetical protein